MLIARISPLAVREQLALRADLCRDHSSAPDIASRSHRACCPFMKTVLVPQSSVRATWVLTPSCTTSPSHSDIPCTTTGLQVACISLLPGRGGMSSLRGMVQQEGSTHLLFFLHSGNTDCITSNRHVSPPCAEKNRHFFYITGRLLAQGHLSVPSHTFILDLLYTTGTSQKLFIFP